MATKRLVLAAAGALLLGSVGIAYAHAAYARSEPGAGAVVAAAPAQVSLWFTQELFRRAGENGLEVLGPDGAPVHAGAAAVDDDDRRLLTVALAADLAPGVYTVTWRNLSAEDGDTDAGSFTFTLDPAAEVTSTPMPAEATPMALPAATVAAPPTATPAPAGGLGCRGAQAPDLGLVALGFGLRRRRQGQR